MRGGKRKGAGRPLGSFAKIKRIKTTVYLYPEDLKKLDDLGPSRGKAISKLIKDKNL